jgi:hypothetical protein
VGPSAALNVVGAVKAARRLDLKGDQTVATVLCDGGDRYSATTFDGAWQRDKGLVPASEGTSLDFVRPHDEK